MDITDKAQARLLEHPFKRRLLKICAHTDRSVAELAGATDAPLQRVHYHIRTLVAGGLLTVARTLPRGGRPIKYYRAVSDNFLIPDALADDPDRAFWAYMQGMFENRWARSQGSRCIRFLPNGKATMEKVAHPDDVPQDDMEAWVTAKLSPDAMRALHQDILALVKTAAAEADSRGAKTYLLHVATVPYRR